MCCKIGLESNLVLHVTVDISHFLQEQTCYVSTHLNTYLSLFQDAFHTIKIGEEVAIVTSHILLPDPFVKLEEVSLVIVKRPNLIMLVQFFQDSKSLYHHSLAFGKDNKGNLDWRLIRIVHEALLKDGACMSVLHV